MGNIANTIYTLPLANILKDNGYRVDYVTSERGFSVLNKNPKVDRIFLMSMEKWSGKWMSSDTWEAFFKQIDRVKLVEYDIVIDCQQDIRSLLTFAMCNGKRKLTYSDAKGFSAIGGNEILNPKIGLETRNIVERNLNFLKYLKIAYNEVSFPLPESEYTYKQRYDKTFELLDPNKKIVVISAGAKNENKRWAATNWKTLIERIKDKYNLILTGSISDKLYIKEIGGDNYLNLTGETRIESLIELLRRTDLVITNDTETAAIAWAVRKPKIITIYTCSDPEIYSPVDYYDKEKYKSLYGNLDCQPCNSSVCFADEAKCRKFPTVEDVIRAIS